MNSDMEYQKSQTVRLIDVFMIGPLMIYAGLSTRRIPDLAKFALAGTGLLTIAYNYENYRLNRVLSRNLKGSPP